MSDDVTVQPPREIDLPAVAASIDTAGFKYDETAEGHVAARRIGDNVSVTIAHAPDANHASVSLTVDPERARWIADLLRDGGEHTIESGSCSGFFKMGWVFYESSFYDEDDDDHLTFTIDDAGGMRGLTVEYRDQDGAVEMETILGDRTELFAAAIRAAADRADEHEPSASTSTLATGNSKVRDIAALLITGAISLGVGLAVTNRVVDSVAGETVTFAFPPGNLFSSVVAVLAIAMLAMVIVAMLVDPPLSYRGGRR